MDMREINIGLVRQANENLQKNHAIETAGNCQIRIIP